VAAGLGIGGVPFYVIDDRSAVSGGQPAEVWLRTLDAIGRSRSSSPRAAPALDGKTEAPAACVTARSCARSSYPGDEVSVGLARGALTFEAREGLRAKIFGPTKPPL